VRRLILAATTCGLGGIPGDPLALVLLASPLHATSPTFFRATAPFLYGRAIAADGRLLREQVDARRARPPTAWGYVGQLVGAAGWTSLPWLHHVRAPVLVLTGRTDRIVPPVNARILAARLPCARIDHVRGGHLFLLEHPAECADTISDFLQRADACGDRVPRTPGSR
jgi:pimeloyl-ACP methyl ester carboxylesterase